MKGIFSSWKQKPPRRQPARVGCDSPSTQRRDWQRHEPHKGSQTLCCPLPSPVEPPGRRVWVFILVHSKLNLFSEGRGEFHHLSSFPALASWMCFPPTAPTMHFTFRRQRTALRRKLKIYHSWSGNIYGEKHPCQTVRSTLEENLSCITNLFSDCFCLQKTPSNNNKKINQSTVIDGILKN